MAIRVQNQIRVAAVGLMISHDVATFEKCVTETNATLPERNVSYQKFRTRFVHAENTNVSRKEALLAVPNHRAFNIFKHFMEVRKSPIANLSDTRTKTSILHVRLIEAGDRSYDEVVKNVSKTSDTHKITNVGTAIKAEFLSLYDGANTGKNNVTSRQNNINSSLAKNMCPYEINGFHC